MKKGVFLRALQRIALTQRGDKSSKKGTRWTIFPSKKGAAGIRQTLDLRHE
jgi:hypothetical protein